MLRRRGPASAEAVAGGPLPDRRQQETGPDPPGVLSAMSAPEGAGHGFRAAGLATPGPRSLRFGSASRGNLGAPLTAVKGPSEGDSANTGDFRPAVAGARTLGRAADRGL